MRKRILGLTTAALAVGSLSLGLGSAPTHAVGGLDGGNLSFSGTLPTDVAVAGTTPGDAVAAWIRPAPDGVTIHAAHATNGDWAPPVQITPGSIDGAEDLHLVANAKGDVVAVWTQLVLGKERVRGARYLGNGTWDGSAALSGPDTTGITATDADIDDAGRLHVAVSAEVNATDPIRATLWEKGKSPVYSPVAGFGVAPAIDVSPSGVALIAYRGPQDGKDVAFVARRTASSGWGTPDQSLWPDDVFDVHVGVSDDGRGTLLFGAKDGSVTRAVSAKVTVEGSVGGPDIVSSPGVSTARRSLTVTGGNTAVASWSEFDGNDYSLRSAVRKPSADFGTPSLVVASSNTQPASVPFASDSGRRVVVHDADHKLTFRHQVSAIQLFATYDGGRAEGGFAADVDSQGNVVAASIVDNGGSGYVQADFLDVVGPTSVVSSPGAQVLSKKIPVKWTATDSLSGVKNSDVIVTSAKWNSSTFTAPVVIGDNQLTGPYPFTASFGRTYCFDVQSADKANNLGSRSARKCTSVPLDDASLKGSGWSRRDKSGHFNDTVTTTSKKGRVLTRTNVKARRLALVATKLPSAGTVKVTFNGKSLGTFSLKGKTTKKKVIPIVTFSKVRSGTVKIKVISPNGRAILIDGLVVAK